MCSVRCAAAADDDPTDNKKPHGAKLAMSVAAILICPIIGAIFFCANGEFESDFGKALWWSFVTVTTVG